MYFYNNHLREAGEFNAGGPPMAHIEKTGGDLNSSVNLPSNSRTQADNFVSGQPNLTLTERSQQWNNNANNRVGPKYQQVLSKARLSKEGPNKQQPSNPTHRQQRSQLGTHNFIGQNQIYYNDHLRDQKHMSLPYLNEHKSRQPQGIGQGSHYNNTHDSNRKGGDSELLGPVARGTEPDLLARSAKRNKDHASTTHRKSRAAEAAYTGDR